MNPCPVHDARTATVFLFFIAVRGRTPESAQIASGRNAARLCCVTSRDAGRSWGAARDLTEEAVGSAEQGRWGGLAWGWSLHPGSVCTGRGGRVSAGGERRAGPAGRGKGPTAGHVAA